MQDKFKKKYEGKVFQTNSSGSLVIDKYVDNKNVHVRFTNTGYRTVVSMGNIKTGMVKDRLKPTVFGVGITGDISGKIAGSDEFKEYKLWSKMLQRCYDVKLQEKYTTYVGCSVSENFKYYQHFKKWCHEQTGFNKNGFELDKDLLIKGNKEYSEDTCVFLPHQINSTLTKSDKVRGKYPIGVTYDKKSSQFRAQITICGDHLVIGFYATPEEAFQAYKATKEAYIKEVANKWKAQIDPRAYEALMNYRVEITD